MNARTGHLVVGLAVIVGAMLVLDAFLWSATGLEDRIGSFTGLSSALDKSVNDLVRPMLEREDLEDRFATAGTFSETESAARALAKYYEEKEERENLLELYRRLQQRFPRSLTPFLLRARMELLKDDLAAGRTEAARAAFARLTDLVIERANQATLLEAYLAAARSLPFEEAYQAALERLRARPGIPPRARSTILSERILYLRLHGDPAAVAEIEKEMGSMQLAQQEARLFSIARSRLLQDVKKGMEIGPVLDRLRNLRRSFPDQVTGLWNLWFSLVGTFSSRRDAGAVARLWVEGGEWPKEGTEQLLRGSMEPKVNEVIGRSSQLLLRENKEESFRLLVDNVERLFPDAPLLPYLVGERWARGEREGPPPQRVYRVVHRPEAKIRIDGKLEEPVYENVPMLPEPFWIGAAPGGAIREADSPLLRMRLLTTKESLILAGSAVEPTPGRILRSTSRTHRLQPWRNDCVELFLDPNRDLNRYQQWVVDSMGQGLHLLLGTPRVMGREFAQGVTDMPPPTEAPLRTAAARGEEGYVVEMAIPLSHLGGLEAVRGRLMRANVRRLRYIQPGLKPFTPDFQPSRGRGDRLEVISWAPMHSGHNPDRFHFFLFE